MIRLITFTFLLFSFEIIAQSKADSLKIPLASKATKMSAILPGLGQVYNRQIWKAPIIYAGMASFIVSIRNNHKAYIDYKSAYQYESDDDPSTVNPYPQYDKTGLALFRDAYRRNLDLSVIGLTFIYVLNIVDANVSAHLYYFRLNKNLEISLKPSLEPNKLLCLQFQF